MKTKRSPASILGILAQGAMLSMLTAGLSGLALMLVVLLISGNAYTLMESG